jgi:hypothetical protein
MSATRGRNAQGASGSGSVSQSEVDALSWGKSWFEREGLLPATRHFEHYQTWPASDFANPDTSTQSRSRSVAQVLGVGTTDTNFGWDLGSAKSKILAVCGGVRPRGNSISIFFGATLPAAGDPPGELYNFGPLPFSSVFDISKRTGAGVWSSLLTESDLDPDNVVGAVPFGLAFYYNDTTNKLIGLVRFNGSQWFPLLETTDTSFTTFRYVGFRVSTAGAQKTWLTCPLAIYYE